MKENRKTPECSTGAALTAALAAFLLALGQGAVASEAEDSQKPEAAAKAMQAAPGTTPTQSPASAASPASPASPASSLASMTFSFKLDPRLAGGTYGGERWVSPPTYMGAAAQDTVDARVDGTDAKGRPVSISPKWVPSEPEMVTVSPAEGRQVKIAVKRAGECLLKVSSDRVSRELTVKGTVRNAVMQVEIRQAGVKKPPATPAPQATPPPRSPAPQPPAVKNKEAGEAFLAANRTREGVVTLESGLQYKILKASEGKKPTLDSTVVCQYRGILLDGTVLANTIKRKKPVSFQLKKAIKGWSEALQLMPVGSKWQLYIPPSLGFGERGSRKSGIGPNATLIFEVELLAIKEPGTRGNETTSASAEPPASEN